MLENWIARQRRYAIAGLLRAVAPPLVKTREGFGQIIVPSRGSVVASPVPAGYDPDPDYFFHWYRDSALVMDALALVREDVPGARGLFADFVDFSLNLSRLDGRAMPANWRAAVAPDFMRFLRHDLEQVHGEAIAADTRVNPDGTLDITDWPRPQHDGPALRVLAILRWGVERQEEGALLRQDLAFLLSHLRQPCFDIWEEEVGLHYYTLCVGAAALCEGAAFLAASEPDFSRACREEAERVAVLLEGFWLTEEGYLRSRILADGRSPKELDIAVILAANHARVPVQPKLAATLDQLAALFAASYAINRDGGGGPAMGRYAGDRYYAGGAYYFSTLAAAEFCYRAGNRARGDAFLERVRRFTPDDGLMAEQFDQTNGAPASAKDLAWSHAAFLTCIQARQTGV